MLDLIEKEKSIRAFQGGVRTRLLRQAYSLLFFAGVCVVAYGAYVLAGLRAASETTGDIRGAPVLSAVKIFRDALDIPHIRAQNDRDAFFAEGYAQASDRLFQMDLIRRYVYGRLSEVLGPIQLPADEAMRAYDARGNVTREWRALPGRDREALAAFSDGVNAAMRREPLPIEFRLLLYRPAPWAPQDSLCVVLAISISLDDTPENVRRRDRLWRALGAQRFARLLPLSDPAYDVPSSGRRRPAPIAAPPAWALRAPVRLTAVGSNAWAVGARRTLDGHALLANDPHLAVGVPGIWYAVEMRAPGLHVAGVTIPGVPGVVLGHNDAIAWGSTNAMAATVSLFRTNHSIALAHRRELFHVRFSADVTKDYYGSLNEFADGPDLVRWRPASHSHSEISTVLELDRARDMAAAIRALAKYGGPPQNFVLADTDGRVAYHLAGTIPNDPAWGRYVHQAGGIPEYPDVPFPQLPAVAPSRAAIVLSANNKMYSKAYPYRLSAMFAPPYRAYRIAALLRARRRYDAAYFARMQLDAYSPADAEFAREVLAYAGTHPGFLPASDTKLLRAWRGDFSPESKGATLEHELRSAVERESLTPYDAFTALRTREPPEAYIAALRGAVTLTSGDPVETWSRSGAVPVFHPFGAIGFPFLNGAPLAGNGDANTVRMQTPDIAQSFRAVWEPGEWERGGISLPNGESGEVGSKHYADLRTAWERGILVSLPFSDAAVRRASRSCLMLRP